jgi:hypothetical protein
MHSRRTVPTQRSAIAFARGARAGVLMILMLVEVNTSLMAAVNLVSRSRMRSRNRSAHQQREHGPVGRLGPGPCRPAGASPPADAKNQDLRLFVDIGAEPQNQELGETSIGTRPA